MHCARVTVFIWSLLVPSMLAGLCPVACGDDVKITRTEDVIYGRKFGTALTLDVFVPEKPNGIGLLYIVSGGWYSAHDAIQPGMMQEYLRRGYTVFAVVHGSQPKFTIPECMQDVRRAVRFIRSRAGEYHVDPQKIGVTGASAGGHLSLVLGTTGDDGNPQAKDPIDRVSSRIQAVACFFPPTDFLNYGKPGENAIGRGVLAGFRAPFDFHEFDAGTREFERISDPERVLELGKLVSPVYQASADDAPTLIIHGDKDELVPLQQGQLMIDALQAAKVPAKLTVKPGAAHGWANLNGDVPQFADWFDEHLRSERPSN